MSKKKKVKLKLKRRFKSNINLEKLVAVTSVMVIIFYLFAHTIMQSAIAQYNRESQLLTIKINQLQSETASLDKERQQLVDPTKVAEFAMAAGLEFQPDRRYTLMID